VEETPAAIFQNWIANEHFRSHRFFKKRNHVLDYSRKNSEKDKLQEAYAAKLAEAQ